MNIENLSESAKSMIKKYSNGEMTAEAVAYELWRQKMTEDPDPRAADVVFWSKSLCYGIPSISAEEARVAAERAVRYFSENLNADGE